jgi:hypothetical protein
VDGRTPKLLLRVAAMWGVLIIAAVVAVAVASATRSVTALVAIMAVGFLVTVVLRFKVWR